MRKALDFSDKITDNKGRVKEYSVYRVDRYADPSDVSYFEKTNDYHVTLVTCENGGKTRIIVRANAS